MRLSISLDWNKPKWLSRLFPCRHKVVMVEENFDSRYGCHSSYMYCLKCGRQADEISRHCKHEVNSFGKCFWCKSRIEKFDCEHVWVPEPDTDESFCEKCGVWRDEELDLELDHQINEILDIPDDGEINVS